MLMEWMRGKSAEEPVAAAKPTTRKALDVDPETPLEPSRDEAVALREDAFRKKLAASVKEGPQTPAKLVTYETLFRNAQSVLMDGHANEFSDGLTLNLSRNAQNVMVTSKCVLVNPQMSHWEVGLQMNGFSDIMMASYNTLSRWNLMYQRVSSTGALLLAQCMAQKQQGMTQGTVVGMLQYPWVPGGCAQAQYVKEQSFTMSHTQRIIRGVHIGSNFSWEPATKTSAVSFAASAVNPAKSGSLAAEWAPSKGEWKLAMTRIDWSHDAEFALQLEYAEKRQGKLSLMSFGMRKHFIGGSMVTAALSGFSKLKATLELPFGGERSGVNQLRCTYNCQYDIHSGALKHGLTFTA